MINKFNDQNYLVKAPLFCLLTTFVTGFAILNNLFQKHCYVFRYENLANIQGYNVLVQLKNAKNT